MTSGCNIMFQVALNLLALRHLTSQMFSEMMPFSVFISTELKPSYKGKELERASFAVFPPCPISLSEMLATLEMCMAGLD